MCQVEIFYNLLRSESSSFANCARCHCGSTNNFNFNFIHLVQGPRHTKYHHGLLKHCINKNAVWAKHEADINLMVSNMPKIKDRYSDDIKERDYIKRMSLQDTRIWFQQRSRMTLRIIANRSSVFTGNMGCRYCEEDIRVENQEHL